MEKLIDAPLFNVISVIAEAQTFKDWVPMNYRSDILHEVSHFRKLGEFAVKVPWPFYNRSVYIAVCAMPVRNENAIVITMKSLEGNTWLKGLNVVKDESCAECDVNFCSAYIESLSEN
jgi:hypothetical protein